MKYLYIMAKSPHIQAVIAENDFELEQILLKENHYSWDDYRHASINSAVKIPIDSLESKFIHDGYCSFIKPTN